MTTYQQLLQPIWDSEVIIREPVTMYCGKKDKAYAPLLFIPEEIECVTDLSGDTVYQQGRDWELEGRNIILAPSSCVSPSTYSDFFPTEHQDERDYPYPGGFSLFAPNEELVKKQLQVTYRCKKNQWTGHRPCSAKGILKNTFMRLKTKSSLRVVINGDSISVGRQSTKNLQIPPYQPGYADLLVDALKSYYNADIQYVNTSVGGMGTNWAIENIENNILTYQPDLLIIAFGMNDGSMEPDQFGANIREMIQIVRTKLPDTEIILVATSLPNPILTDTAWPFCGKQHLFYSQLERISEDPLFGGGIAVANITKMHEYMLSKKRYWDLSSNNVNHPNDFLYRAYAQYLMRMLME